MKRLIKNQAVRFAACFIFLVILFFVLNGLDFFRENFNRPATNATAFLGARFIDVFTDDFNQRGNRLRFTEGGITVEDGCNGMYAAIIFVSGVLAFPAALRWKLFGLLAGVPAIFFINLFRIFALFFIAKYWPDHLHTAHVTGGQLFTILLAGGLWFIWAQFSVRK